MEFEFDGKTYTVDPDKIYRYHNFDYSKGFTPLMYLVSELDDINYDKFEEFVKNNKDQINIQNNYKYTALTIVCRNDRLNDKLINKEKSKEKIIKILLDAGADPNLQERYGNTALLIACGELNKNIIKMLINSKNINLNITNNFGETALMHLLFLNDNINNTEKLNIMSLLINKGIDINIRDTNYGYNILCHTYISNNDLITKENIIKLILDTNINLKTTDKTNKSGFEYICEYSSEEIIKDCFAKHNYYDVNILKQCIKITIHKTVVINILKKLYSDKVSCLNSY